MDHEKSLYKKSLRTIKEESTDYKEESTRLAGCKETRGCMTGCDYKSRVYGLNQQSMGYKRPESTELNNRSMDFKSKRLDMKQATNTVMLYHALGRGPDRCLHG